MRHWSLRARLALAATGLAALALVAANAVGLVLLENYLIDRVDGNLDVTGGSFVSETAARQLVAERLDLAQNEDSMVEFLAERFGGDFRMYIYGSGGEGGRIGIPRAPEGAGPRLPSRGALAERAGDVFTVPGESGADWRVAVRGTGDGSSSGVLVVTAVSLAEVEETTERLLLIDVLVTVVVLTGLAGVAALVVRAGLRPLTRMEATADAIAAGDFRRRVDGTDPHTEPGRLGGAMNAMLGRLEHEIAARTASERRLRRFLADASHELRTPLTSIRGFAELSRRGGDRTDALRRIEAEAARMGVLVEDLLLLARLDERRELERRPVDLLELAADVVRDLHARSPGRDVRLVGAMRPVVVPGDVLRLRQVLGNLLSNADRHTPADARICVRVDVVRPGDLGAAAAAAGEPLPPGVPAALVEVADSGHGVPAEHAPYVFERLYRVDGARSRGRAETAGSGLGLSIVAALAGAHGGRVDLAAGALVGWPAAEELLGFDGYATTVYTRAAQDSVADVQTVLGATANPEDPSAVQVSRPSDAIAAKEATDETLAGLLLGLGAVALLVGGVGVANTMVISVLERRSEIGLRRSMGTTKGQIRTQFLCESLLLSALGGLGGLLLGIGVTGGYASYQGWPAVVPAWAMAGGIAATLVLGGLAGFYPAVRAARLPPTEALASA